MKKSATTKTPGLSTTAEIRQRARKNIKDGAITSSYPDDKATIVRLLNEALATELVCVLRYKRHYYATNGIRAKAAERIAIESYREAITYVGDRDPTTRRLFGSRIHTAVRRKRG